MGLWNTATELRAQVCCFWLMLEWFDMPDCGEMHINIANSKTVGDMHHTLNVLAGAAVPDTLG